MKWLVVILSTCSCLLFPLTLAFEPYELNGGLVSAVAGKDFCIMATDTRMFGGGGYNLASRHHLAARLWTVDDSTLLETVEELLRTTHSINNGERGALLTERQAQLKLEVGKIITPPIMIGSAGCSTDCEALKRMIRADLRSARHFGNVLTSASTSSLLPDQVATLLSQVLYSRRGFPYYSFCVVAGLDPLENNVGKAFVYDAIGSYEQVAVASAGTGREALQPILDRSFASSSQHHQQQQQQQQQRYVEGTADQAIEKLYHAYQSVSEREIGVGDTLVLCITEQNTETKEVDCRIVLVPLKEH